MRAKTGLGIDASSTNTGVAVVHYPDEAPFGKILAKTTLRNSKPEKLIDNPRFFAKSGKRRLLQQAKMVSRSVSAFSALTEFMSDHRYDLDFIVMEGMFASVGVGNSNTVMMQATCWSAHMLAIAYAQCSHMMNSPKIYFVQPKTWMPYFDTQRFRTEDGYPRTPEEWAEMDLSDKLKCIAGEYQDGLSNEHEREAYLMTKWVHDNEAILHNFDYTDLVEIR